MRNPDKAIRSAKMVARRLARADGGPVESPQPEQPQPRRVPNPVVAYHGSPHQFDKFDASKIGTGEGAQAYGHGLYFADNEDTARYYRNMTSLVGKKDPDWFDYNNPVHRASKDIRYGLSRKFTVDDLKEQGYTREEAHRIVKEARDLVPKWGGHMYQVAIHAHPDHFLDWNKPLRDQHPKVQEALGQFSRPYNEDWDDLTGAEIHSALQGKAQRGRLFDREGRPMALSGALPIQAAAAMQAAGIPGIKYLDQGSRGQGNGTHNYVVFDPNDIEITRRYAKGGDVRCWGGRIGKAGGGATQAEIDDALYGGPYGTGYEEWEAQPSGIVADSNNAVTGPTEGGRVDPEIPLYLMRANRALQGQDIKRGGRAKRSPGGSLSDAINAFSKERNAQLTRSGPSTDAATELALAQMYGNRPQLAIAEQAQAPRREVIEPVTDLGNQIDEGAKWLEGQPSEDESASPTKKGQTGTSPNLSQSAPPKGAPTVASLASYIYQQAPKYGVDPNVALGIALREGLNPNTVSHGGNKDPGQGWAYGPYQLNTVGLAKDFQRHTGIDPSNPMSQYAQVDYALQFMHNNPSEISNGSHTWYSIRDNGGIGNIAKYGSAFAAQNGYFREPNKPIRTADSSGYAPSSLEKPDSEGIIKTPNSDGSFTLKDANGATVGYDRGSAPLSSVPYSQPHMASPSQAAPPTPPPPPAAPPNQSSSPNDASGGPQAQADPMSNLYDKVAFSPDVQSGYDNPQILFDPNAAPNAARGGMMRRADGGSVMPQDAWTHGYQSQARGKSLSDNPHANNPQLAPHWEAGWQQGKKEEFNDINPGKAHYEMPVKETKAYNKAMKNARSFARSQRADGGEIARMPTNELIARALDIIRRRHAAAGGTQTAKAPTLDSLQSQYNTLAQQQDQQRQAQLAMAGADRLNATNQLIDATQTGTRGGYQGSYNPRLALDAAIETQSGLWRPNAPQTPTQTTPTPNTPAVTNTPGNNATTGGPGIDSPPTGSNNSDFGPNPSPIPMANPQPYSGSYYNNTLDQVLGTNNPTQDQIFGYTYPTIPPPKPQPVGPISQNEINGLYGFGGGSQMGTGFGMFQSGGAIVMDAALSRARRASKGKR